MTEGTGICLVCSTPNSSLHFGVNACRACTAFFKRATVLGLRYPCRQAQRTCDVARGMRNGQQTCRGCRYDKCVAVGMTYAGPLRWEKRHAAKVTTTTSENVDETDVNEPSTSGSSILQRIERDYAENVLSREQKELTLLKGCQSIRRLQGLSKEVYIGNSDLTLRTLRITLEEIWRIIPNSHPSLSQLTGQEQMNIYRAFFPNFVIIDNYYRTWKIWGSFDKYIMCSATMCMDPASMLTWTREDEGGCDRGAMINSAEEHLREQIRTVAPSFLQAQVTEREVAALLALSLCDIDIPDCSVTLLTSLDSIREDTLADLQKYYREEMGLIDFSARLGNLMNICNAVRECNSKSQEFFRMQITMFDMYTTETFLKEMVL
ncbi:hypothetical protein PMAYCL1PPCAC_16875, partial [Pristionchus mayeri]